MRKNNPFFFLWLVAFLFTPLFVFGQVSPEPTVRQVIVQEVTLPEPSISISPDTFQPLDDVLYIVGRGVPGSVVSLMIQKEGETPLKFTVEKPTDSFGEWTITEKTYLSSGLWEVRARQQFKGEISDWSNPRVIRSVVTGVNILGFKVKYAVITIVLLVFFAVVTAILVYFIRKIKALKKGLLTKQLQDTEASFHENISSIRRELMGELQAIVANSQNRPLTPEELQRRDHLLTELDGLEKNIEHNIQNIGRQIQ